MRSIFSVLGSLQRNFIEPSSHIEDVEIRHKSRLLNTFLLSMVAVFIFVDGAYLFTLPGYRPPWYGYLFMMGAYLLNRGGIYRVAAFLALAMFPAMIFVDVLSGNASNPISALYYLVPGMVLAGILLSFRATGFFAVLEIIVILLMPVIAPEAFPHFHQIVGPVSSMAITAVLVLVSQWSRRRVEMDRQAFMRHTEEKYRNIVENAIDGVFQSTLEGRFISVNPAMARMYGYGSPGEMIRAVTDISSQLHVHPEARSALLKRMADGEKIMGFESQHYRRDGSTIWTSVNVQAVRDPYGKILYYEGMIEDISSRKKVEAERLEAEQALQQAETLYRTLVERTSIVVYRDRPDGSATPMYISPQIEALLGYSPEDWVADPGFWKSVVHPDDLERVLEGVEHYLSEKTKTSIEYRMKTRDGHWRWVHDETVVVRDQAGRPQFVHGVLLDITERRQAEEMLLQFRQVMDESNDAIFLIDPETSGYIDFNRSAHEQLGYTREQLGRLGVIDVALHITTMEIWCERVALVRERNGLIFESIYRRRDGSTFPVEVSAQMLDQPGRTIMVATVRDITERKQAETAVRESEERFRKIFYSSPIAICITTIDEGRLLNANQAYWDITGYPADNSIGRNAEELSMWDEPDERVEFVRQLREKHSISNPDDYFYHTNGTLKKVMSFYELIQIGDQDCILSMFYDMSMQKQLEMERENLIRQLGAQNAESETLREGLASILGTFEFSEIIQHILDQIKRVVPYDSASIWRLEDDKQRFISGRNLPPMFDSGDVVFSLSGEANSAIPILTGKVPYILNNNVQEELVDFNEEPHTYVNSWLAIPLKTRGKIIGLIALDGKTKGQFNEHHAELAVTFADQVAIALENSRLFAELQNELFMREKLIQELESKNVELERFTYTVSHDLKSPLVTINGFLGYLERDAETGNIERLKNDMRRIQDAVNRMHRLLSELLELSRIGRLMNQPENIPFDDLVREVLDIVHGRLEARRISVHTQPDLPVVHGDRQRLIEVLQNLIDNAAKFMGSQVDPRVEIGWRGEEEGRPIFFVKDNGIGIAPEYHERIFGLFNKLDTKTDGTGIGLALVKRIVEVHGGRIWVESEAGRGATFCFTLARAASTS
jgi:PAS domain S-box-containing protein